MVYIATLNLIDEKTGKNYSFTGHLQGTLSYSPQTPPPKPLKQPESESYWWDYDKVIAYLHSLGLKMGRYSVEDAHRHGRLAKPTKMGRRSFWTKSQIDDWIDSL